MVAATTSTLPSLLMLELAGAARTDFVVFTVFVLFLFCLAVSAVSGLPYLINRWRRGETMEKMAFSNRISGPFVGGAMLASMFIALLSLYRREHLMLWLVIAGIVSALGGALAGALFLASMRLHHFSGELSKGQGFVAGAGITLFLGMAVALILHFVPTATSSPHDHLRLALVLNALFFVPVIFGLVMARRLAPHNGPPG